MLLATALAKKGEFTEAIEVFRRTDELASKVQDQEVLDSLQYDDLYSFVLYAEAENRYKKSSTDLLAIRMFEEALEKDPSELIKKNRMTQLHALLASAKLLSGSKKSAAKIATDGKVWANKEGFDDYIPIFETIIEKSTQP
jgi:tetratricopeptide (TPR) repeat protein